MSKSGRLLAVAILLGASAAIGAGDSVDTAAEKTPAELKRGIENEHPAAYYILAQKLFAEGEKDEAVFWFYAGQIRFRFHLAAHPDLDPSGDPALFASLSEVLGRPLNEYAFGDLQALLGTLDRALKWDRDTPNGFTPKDAQPEAWQATRAGLEEMRKYIAANADTIRRERAANGLENRK